MDISRGPLTLDYFDEKKHLAVKWEGWHQTKGYADREYISGNRLIIRRDLVQKYLQKENRNLVFTVRLIRQKTYDRRGPSDSYDHGKTKAYILTQNGEIIPC